MEVALNSLGKIDKHLDQMATVWGKIEQELKTIQQQSNACKLVVKKIEKPAFLKKANKDLDSIEEVRLLKHQLLV